MEVAAGEWNALLARLALTDVYLTREYVESACLLEPGEPVFLADEGVVFPLILRAFEERADVVTPYGYGGPVAVDPAAAGAFYDAYEGWCRDRAVVSTFVRFHSLYENERYSRFHVDELGATIAWRLGGDDPFERLHAHHRRLVRKAEREGLTATAGEGADLGEFVSLYEQTMRRLDADPFYLFSAGYWTSLDALPTLLVEVRREGELLAAVLCFASPPWLHYHLGAQSDEGRRLGGSHLALLTAARWAREHAYELFHLGGGIGSRRDSLFEFKQRFDPESPPRPFAVGKAIHDEAAYAELAGTTSLDGFFPAYRDTSRR
jgi:serine/alanine adding enzyme